VNRLGAPTGQSFLQTKVHRMKVELGAFGDLCLQGSAQSREIVFHTVEATAERLEGGIEFRLGVDSRTLQPERPGRLLEPARALHQGTAEPVFERLRDQGQQPLGRVAHQRNHALGHTIAPIPEQPGQLGLAETASTSLRLDQPLGLQYGERLVQEGQRSAQIIFLEVREQHVGFLRPRSVDAGHLSEPRLPRFLVKLSQDSQPSVSPSEDRVRVFARASGHHQRLFYPGGADGRLDPLVV
jgi:hypothetical protein